ncbi:uncharacterized protein LOC127879220 [Dreissena polymorpha]|uniref:Uncharacterized protein n=1 Tax=Dreissena polymorpha TaxID=45954 RepID=A0A9D4K971_DREPO|nr:uncharacterized protein LOC127879220 [Dreissena polymorpha]KAH3835478.1 hypothetical protein DPMN_108827 [Dreissena polymorpha]
MQTSFVFLAVIVACYAATTIKPNHVTHTTHAHFTHADHTTNEPAERDMITFQFQPTTHHLLVKTKPDRLTTNCYIATLTDTEHANIHTDYGMRSVELRLLAALGSATAVTDVSTLDQRDIDSCGMYNHERPHYYTISV